MKHITYSQTTANTHVFQTNTLCSNLIIKIHYMNCNIYEYMGLKKWKSTSDRCMKKGMGIQYSRKHTIRTVYYMRIAICNYKW